MARDGAKGSVLSTPAPRRLPCRHALPSRVREARCTTRGDHEKRNDHMASGGARDFRKRPSCRAAQESLQAASSRRGRNSAIRLSAAAGHAAPSRGRWHHSLEHAEQGRQPRWSEYRWIRRRWGLNRSACGARASARRRGRGCRCRGSAAGSRAHLPALNQRSRIREGQQRES